MAFVFLNSENPFHKECFHNNIIGSITTQNYYLTILALLCLHAPKQIWEEKGFRG